jgi:hypothetical protein
VTRKALPVPLPRQRDVIKKPHGRIHRELLGEWLVYEIRTGIDDVGK